MDKVAIYKIWCNGRAIEWGRLPIFISQPLVPSLLIFLPAMYILSFFVILTGFWSFFLCYRCINLGIANYAYFAVQWSKWFIAIACSAYLISRGEIATGILAILWPPITIVIAAILPVDVPYITAAFWAQWDRYVKK